MAHEVGGPPLKELEHPTLLMLTHRETRVLQAMFREQIANDLDLLEDLAYARQLAGPSSDDAIERVALAVRLDVGLQRQGEDE